jgi:Xaa-Pro aminopeptidase
VVAKATVPRIAYSIADLDRFRTVQRHAYDVAAKAEASLRVGMTERELAELLDDIQRGDGVTQFFHEHFVWFGERTCLGEDWVRGGTDPASLEMLPGSPFSPTGTMLAANEPLILDIAPIINGYASDIGYSSIIGQNDVFDELIAGLEPVRGFLQERVRGGDTLKRIYQALDAFIADNGWTSVHRCYPLRALGHLLMHLDPGAAAGESTGASVWNDSPDADLPPTPGVWAVEPHIGKNRVGAKWEEMLVVTADDAFWLDEDLPHHRRWAGESPLPP